MLEKKMSDERPDMILQLGDNVYLDMIPDEEGK